ncbi:MULTISPECIES: hypothetical protein [Streptomyces]|uniref:hypothetical protein n=1 Tax=Streptomyces TaxID=1883 RepID=UPI0033192B48
MCAYITEQLEVNAVGKGAGWFRDDVFFETDNARYRWAAAVEGRRLAEDLGLLPPAPDALTP